jgi:hypothetical protein
MHSAAENQLLASGSIACCAIVTAFMVGKLSDQQAVASTNITGACHRVRTKNMSAQATRWQTSLTMWIRFLDSLSG